MLWSVRFRCVSPDGFRRAKLLKPIQARDFVSALEKAESEVRFRGFSSGRIEVARQFYGGKDVPVFVRDIQ